MTTEQTVEIRQRIALAAGAALLIAGVILVTCILPAEFGLDPLGTGAKLGLLELGVTGQQVQALEASKAAGGASGVSTVAHQEAAFKAETVDFKIGPRQGMEYKTASTKARRSSTRGRLRCL